MPSSLGIEHLLKVCLSMPLVGERSAQELHHISIKEQHCGRSSSQASPAVPHGDGFVPS